MRSSVGDVVSDVRCLTHFATLTAILDTPLRFSGKQFDFVANAAGHDSRRCSLTVNDLLVLLDRRVSGVLDSIFDLELLKTLSDFVQSIGACLALMFNRKTRCGPLDDLQQYYRLTHAGIFLAFNLPGFFLWGEGFFCRLTWKTQPQGHSANLHSH